MRHDHGSCMHMAEEHIDEVIRILRQRQEMHQSLADAPELRLADDIRRAYRDETNQDRHSLERVFLRLVENQETDRSKIVSISRRNQGQERISVMQKDTIQSLSQNKTGWKRRLSVVAAILCTMMLIGGFLLVFNVVRTDTGSQVAVTPTPRPTTRPASQVFPRVVLTDSPTNGEGVGPGFNGIPSVSQFIVGQRIWLLYEWSADESGLVVVKWYANGHLYRSSSQYMDYIMPYPGQKAPTPGVYGVTATPVISTTPSLPISSSFTITYSQPAAGKVELYWDGQLALSLSFTVKSGG